jgi:KaiC/GvpD/RAD55 family RecA-like ATPase
LDKIIGTKGTFVCLLGGKSTGKSLVLRHFEKKNLTNVFVVDLRETEKGDILKELLRVLTNRKSFYIDLVNKSKSILTLIFLGLFYRNGPESYSEIFADFEKILGNEEAVESLPSLITELVKHRGKVTLIIDEANIAFTITDDTTSAALALFTQLTKQLLHV